MVSKIEFLKKEVLHEEIESCQHLLQVQHRIGVKTHRKKFHLDEKRNKHL